MSRDVDLLNAPELLAPAGGPKALVAAVQNGADAVYLGLHDLNARRGAQNFDADQLAEATDYAHLRGVKVYLAANTLVLPGDMRGALELVDGAWAAGVDAVIVQDLGLMSVLERSLPEVRIHASTQAGAHNAADVAALAALGVERVTLARELTIDEITHIHRASEVEVESFAHGALCFSYSGHCLFSSMIGGRSANRGLCTQPCRMSYTLERDGRPVEGPGPYLLSMKDLVSVGRLPELVRAGVAALKIEGRMKSPEYVALVTGVYRRALDRAVADPDGFEVTEGEWEVLEEAFNRGLTEGHLTGERGEDLMSFRRRSNRGVTLGRTVSVSPGSALVRLERSLDPEDEIEIWTSAGSVRQKAGELQGEDGPLVSAPAGADVRIAVAAPVGRGDRVFRTENAALLHAARRTFDGRREQRPIPADMRVRMLPGEPLLIEATGAGQTAVAEGPVVEEARTEPLSAETVMEQVGRVGGTPYRVEDWKLELDPRAWVRLGALNETRREAIRGLDELRLTAYRERRRRSPALSPPPVSGTLSSLPRLVAVTDRALDVEACRAAGADEVFLSADVADEARSAPSGSGLALGRIVHDGEFDALLEAATGAPSVIAGDVGLLARVLERGLAGEADWSTNAVNVRSVAALGAMGAVRVWPSPELTGEQLGRIARRSAVPLGVVVLGRQELMVARECVIAGASGCERECRSCGERTGRWLLRDEKGYGFPVAADALGRARVMNAVPLDLTRSLGEVLATGVAAVRVDLASFPEGERASLVSAVSQRLRDAAGGREAPAESLLAPSTTGHFFRGVA